MFPPSSVTDTIARLSQYPLIFSQSTVALLDMPKVLNHHTADNLQKLLTIIGYSLPVLDTQRSDLTNVNMNWNHLQGHFQQRDGYGR